MQHRDYEPTDEDRAGIKAITGEYPTASRVLQMAFKVIDVLADNDKTKMEIILGFELGLRSAQGLDPAITRQITELMDRGRAKVGNQETGMITGMMAEVVQLASHLGGEQHERDV